MSESKSDSKSPYTKEQLDQIAELKAGGMRSELKYLDKKKTDQGTTFYVETKDDEVPDQVDWWQKYALIITRHMSRDGKDVKKTTLRINSEHLKDLLRKCITDYPRVSFDTKEITVDAPYHALFHYRPEIVEASKKLEADSEASKHAQLLLELIDRLFGETREQNDNLFPQGLTTYDLAWTLFRPGKIVFARRYGQQRAFRTTEYYYQYGDHPGLMINGTYIDWDGEDFGTRVCTLTVPLFGGSAPISELEVVPQDLHADREEIKTTLLTRGALFHRYAGMHFAHYSGVAMDMSGGVCRIKRVKVDGRIVVDCKTFQRFKPDMAFDVTALENKSTKSQTEERRFTNGAPPKKRKVSLNEEQMMMCSGLVCGFAFSEKRWLDFYIEYVTPIDWNDKCFDQLVLAESHKNVVKSLVSDHVGATDDSFDDIVEGKGKGLIMVLHGPPGVGKTLTAECVAEYVKRPLYTVSSGDLGTDSETLDERLTEILDMAATWKVVLLIDEADIFLEARSLKDLQRNALVSIFLRVLEYYQGIMFLTTNRVDTFDEAFKSRIHVPLKYSDLSASSRRKIWENFLSKIEGGANVAPSDYEVLSRPELNGRQIKNVIRTAKSLAHYNKKRLDLKMLQSVMTIQEDFEKEMGGFAPKANGVVPKQVNGLVDGQTNGQVNGH